MSRRTPGLRFALAAGLVVLLVGTGTLAGHAYWTAQATKSVTVGAASVAATASGAAGLTAKYTAGVSNVFPAVLGKTAPVTVSNTGTSPLKFAMSISGGTTALNSLIGVQVWKQNGTCTENTVPDTATVTRGTLAAPPVLGPAIATVAPSASSVYCVRTTLSGTFPTTETTTSPTFGFVGTIGTNWTTTATAGSFTQKAAFDWFTMVHPYSGGCLQVQGSGAAAVGQGIILNNCVIGGTASQTYRFVASSNGYYRIYVASGTSTGPVVSASSRGVEMASVASGSDTTALLQQWLPDSQGTSGDFRLVNRFDTSLCLDMPQSYATTRLTVNYCTTATGTNNSEYRAQHFQLVAVP